MWVHYIREFQMLKSSFFFFKFISVVRVNERELNFITISSIIGSARIKVKL